MKKIFGYLLSVAAWLLVLIATFGSAVYAISVVMWLHAPILMVLAATLPVVLALLGAAWLLNMVGGKLRT